MRRASLPEGSVGKSYCRVTRSISDPISSLYKPAFSPRPSSSEASVLLACAFQHPTNCFQRADVQKLHRYRLALIVEGPARHVSIISAVNCLLSELWKKLLHMKNGRNLGISGNNRRQPIFAPVGSEVSCSFLKDLFYGVHPLQKYPPPQVLSLYSTAVNAHSRLCIIVISQFYTPRKKDRPPSKIDEEPEWGAEVFVELGACVAGISSARSRSAS